MTASPEPAARRRLLHDRFDTSVPRGRLVGSPGHETPRLGADPERVLSADDGAARMAPLLTPGWGRSALSYAPIVASPGLVVVFQVLNGHHASQSFRIRRLSRQLDSWARGSRTRPTWQRVPRMLTEARREHPIRRVRAWARHRGDDATATHWKDNLVCGLFTSVAPRDESEVAAGFVVTSTDVGNGTLSVTWRGARLPVVPRLTNLPMVLAIMVRDGSTVFAGSSLPGSRVGGAGDLRPLAVVHGAPDPLVRPGVLQVVSGETGFSVDTRVYDVLADVDGTYTRWDAGAVVADQLVGHGSAVGTDTGWTRSGPTLQRGEHGLVGTGPAFALTDPGVEVALLRARLDECASGGALVFRASGADDHCRVELDPGRWCLVARERGRDRTLAAGPRPPSDDLCVRDDGDGVGVLSSTELLATSAAPRFGTAVGVGAHHTGPTHLSHFEALPARIPLRTAVAVRVLDVPGSNGRASDGDLLVDDFTGAGTLDGRRSRTGQRWERTLGHGTIEVRKDGGAVVTAAPDRTAYTVPWSGTGAEIVTTIVPTGGVKARCRAGVVFVQDDDNHLVLNLWMNTRADGAASLSSFFVIDGYEDVYDAVWVNVGDRLQWDRPARIRVAFDGMHYTAWIDDEPVLWRSLRDVYPNAAPMPVARVGIATNWEWGLDTGSRFLDVRAREVPERGVRSRQPTDP